MGPRGTPLVSLRRDRVATRQVAATPQLGARRRRSGVPGFACGERWTSDQTEPGPRSSYGDAHGLLDVPGDHGVQPGLLGELG